MALTIVVAVCSEKWSDSRYVFMVDLMFHS